jgi:tetratricopeptide (TPR) repeat protein
VDIGETPETSFALRRFSAFAYRQKTDRGETSYLQILASTKARLGDIVGATEIIGELSGTSADFAHMGIAEEWAWRGSIAEAMTAASQISDTRLRDSTLREIALNRTDKINLSDSLEAINKIDDSPARSEALATLALEQAQNGNPAVFHTLERWHASFEGASEFAKDARGTIAVTYGLLGEFEQARQVLDTLPDPESRTWPLWNLTSFLASRGRTQEAIDLANQEESAQPKLHALLGTAQGILDRVSQPKDSTNESFSK